MALQNENGVNQTQTPSSKDQNANKASEAGGRNTGSRMGLSGKLLLLTVLFVMISEVLIFVPSVANYRNNWLNDRLSVGGVAATLLSETETLSPRVQFELLEATGAKAISLALGDTRKLIALSDEPLNITKTIDMTRNTSWDAIPCSLQFLFGMRKDDVRVIGEVDMRSGGRVDMVFGEETLRKDIQSYALNILKLSLIISGLTAALVYLSIRALLLRPLQRLSFSMKRFGDAPENAREIIKPSGRNDEVGDAEIELQSMQKSLNKTLSQQRRMAALGLAVSKINHDMRNLLASAQLFMERLELIPDPTVQRVAPKILASLDRAASYTSSVMSYGKATEAAPELRVVRLRSILGDVEEVLGMVNKPEDCTIRINVPEDLEIEADPEQLFRVMLNLCRNSVQAMEATKASGVVCRIDISCRQENNMLAIYVADTGPGIPDNIKATMFKAFQTSGKAGGTGLGLAIAAEIIAAHGGEISLEPNVSTGACFKIVLPYRHTKDLHENTPRLLHVNSKD